MVKETYIFNELQDLLAEDVSFKQNFRQIANYLKENYEVEICFCEIIGNRRWSYLVGLKGIVVGDKKIKINDNYGIVVNNYSQLNSVKWEEITSFILELYKGYYLKEED